MGALEELGGRDERLIFDQFETNRQKFGLHTDFHEETYTTKLDINNVHPEILEKAERLDNELKNTKTDNRHIAEERGLAGQLEEDDDEEKKYSAVIGK